MKVITSQNKQEKTIFIQLTATLLLIFMITVPIPHKGQLYAQSNSEQGKYTVQIASFKNEEKAKEVAESLQSEGHIVYIQTVEIPGKGVWHRVRIGTFRTEEEATLYKNNIKSQKSLINEAIVLRTEERNEKEPTLAEIYKLLKQIQKKLDEKGIQEVAGYLTGIKIINWSLYVAWGVPIIHNLTIENTSDTAYKDIKIRASYYYSYSTDAIPERTGRVEGILPVTLSAHSKETLSKKDIILNGASAASMYTGAKNMEVVGATPVIREDSDSVKRSIHEIYSYLNR